jgi:hypothetical protein
MSMKTKDLAIIAAYNGKASIASIAQEFLCSPSHVMDVVKKGRKMDLVSRPPRQKKTNDGQDARNAAMAEAYANGETLESIGERYGITRERVRQILASMEVGRRSPSIRSAMKKSHFIASYGETIDNLFEDVRSIQGVIEAMGETSIGAASWIREHLKDRRNEAIIRNHSSKVWSNEDLVAILKQAHRESNSSLSTSNYDKWRLSQKALGYTFPTHAVISWRFGTWNAALATAGLPVNEPNRSYSRTWTTEDAFNAVGSYMRREIAEGRRPTFSGYERYAKATKGTVPSGAYIRYLTGMAWSDIAHHSLKTGV